MTQEAFHSLKADTYAIVVAGFIIALLYGLRLAVLLSRPKDD